MVSQNGKSCSRGLPESWVMMTLSRSSVRIMSRMTRYWLIGVSSESRCLLHSARQAFLPAAMSSFRSASVLPPLPRLCRLSSAMSASSTSAGIADHRMLDAIFLVDVGCVVAGMNDGLARRHGRPEIGAGQARADGKDKIGAAEEIGERFGARARRRAERERMAVGDRALAGIGGDHRRRNELGERRQPFGGLGVMHALSGP